MCKVAKHLIKGKTYCIINCCTVQRDNSMATETRIGIMENFIKIENLTFEYIRDDDQESAPAMLVALESGRTDLVVTDMPTAMAACVAYPDLKLLDFNASEDNFKVSEEEINIGISVKKGNTELLNAINGVLEKMTVDDYNTMMDEAISVQPLSE